MEFPAGTVLLDRDFGTTVVNATDVPNEDVFRAVEQQDRNLYATFSKWANDIRGPASLHAMQDAPGGRRAGNLWHRDRYVTPNKVLDQMRLASVAVAEDDVVSGVLETTESLAFSSMSFFAEDAEEQDVYNQIARKVDLDSRMREIWRDLFTYSQVYIAVTTGAQSFKVRGTTKDGNRRRKVFDVVAPKRITLLDPTKVIPVGSPYGSAFSGTEALAYIATAAEAMQFVSIRNGQERDPVVEEIVVGPYTPDRVEAAELAELGIDAGNLWLLDPKRVFRHTATVPGYRRVAEVRMKSIFELLDMKHQLRQMERAHLLAGSNFIVVITKGTDAHPALPEEVLRLQESVRVTARVPILVGDHRLHVEIVTPKLDNTLRAERWNAIDSRLTARLYGMFMLGNFAAGAGGDDSVKLVKVVARGMESRRHMIRRCLERYVFDPMFENNEAFKTRPKLQFHPRSIALDFDAAYATFLFDLRQQREISRETTLNQFDLDQDLEAKFLEREKEEYDDIFETQVPFSTPNPALAPPGAVPNGPTALPKDNGGGRRGGGGAAPGTRQGEKPRGRPKRPAAASIPVEVTFTINGADGMNQADIKRAFRDALSSGDDDAHEPDPT